LISNNTILQQMTTTEEFQHINSKPSPIEIYNKDTMDYSKNTRDELIALCKEKKIKGYSGKKKSDLIYMLTPPAISPTKLPQSVSTPIPERSHNGSGVGGVVRRLLPKAVRQTVGLVCESSANAESLESVGIAQNLIETTEVKKEIISPTHEEIEKNTFCIGDNIELLKKVKSETIDMIYLDPPYNTGRNFYYFEDKFTDFSKFMEDRIKECHRVLKKNGNIIIHVEPRISHYIRVICDNIFGDSNFQNEIVWHSGGNAKNKYQLGRNHDTIIVYSKSSKSKFFPLYNPYTDKYKKGLKMCPHHKKLYSTSAAHNSQPEVNPRPNLRYEWNGNTRQWYLSQEKMQSFHDDNRLEYNEKGIPRIKRFLDEMEGIPVRDTWDDISSIQNGEKTKYATQKPIKLLERVLSLYSAEGDLCMDPFAGSGTLGRACRNMKRDYILFDINPEAKKVFYKEDE